jgi:hypothetical protein
MGSDPTSYKSMLQTENVVYLVGACRRDGKHVPINIINILFALSVYSFSAVKLWLILR